MLNRQTISNLFFLFVSVVSGCASPTKVHIFSVGINQKQIESLSNLLEVKGYKVIPNQLPVPASIVRDTVIFPAIVKDFATVQIVESAMHDAGFRDIRLIRESEANHSYSTNNIGVYLINPASKSPLDSIIEDPYSLGGSEGTELTYNYFSECPEGSIAQSELNLYPGGAAILEEFIWDERKGQEKVVSHDGEWLSDSRSVRVDYYEEGEQHFSISNHEGSNRFGPFKGLTLINIFSSISVESCNYTHLHYLD